MIVDNKINKIMNDMHLENMNIYVGSSRQRCEWRGSNFRHDMHQLDCLCKHPHHPAYHFHRSIFGTNQLPNPHSNPSAHPCAHAKSDKKSHFPTIPRSYSCSYKLAHSELYRWSIH
jgi:hypothetical protein